MSTVPIGGPFIPDGTPPRGTHVRAAHLTRLATFLLLLVLPALAVTSHAADPFYEHELLRGVDAYSQGRHADAARLLRNATFGFLDEPVRLAEALIYLGLAQSAMSDDDGLADTFTRLVAVDQRFGAYESSSVPPALKSRLEDQLLRRESRLGALGDDESAWIDAIPERAVARLDPARRRAALADLVASEPRRAMWRIMSGELELAEGHAETAVSHATAALDRDPGNARALRLRGLARASLAQWAEARADLERCGLASDDPEVAAALERSHAALSTPAAAPPAAPTPATSVPSSAAALSVASGSTSAAAPDEPAGNVAENAQPGPLPAAPLPASQHPAPTPPSVLSAPTPITSAPSMCAAFRTIGG